MLDLGVTLAFDNMPNRAINCLIELNHIRTPEFPQKILLLEVKKKK